MNEQRRKEVERLWSVLDLAAARKDAAAINALQLRIAPITAAARQEAGHVASGAASA